MYGPPTRTVNDVFRAVKRQFGDESGAQLEDADIIMWVNEALDEIVKRNRMLKATATTTSVPGQSEYAFTTDDVLQVESLHYNGKRIRNMPFPSAEEYIIGNQEDTPVADPFLWYEWGGKFFLWPTPRDAKEIKLFYTQKPDHVQNSGSTLPISDKYFMSIVQYVLKQAYEMDDDLESSEVKSAQFYEGVNFLAEEERTAQNMTYQTITVVD